MINNKLQVKRYSGTDNSGSEYKDYILAHGEPFFDYKRKLLFVGDGVTTIDGLSPFGATDGATIINNINNTPNYVTDKIKSDKVEVHSGDELIEAINTTAVNEKINANLLGIVEKTGDDLIDSINASNSTNKISESHLEIPEQSGDDIIDKINSDASTAKIDSSKVDIVVLEQSGDSIIDAINKSDTTKKILADRVVGGGSPTPTPVTPDGNDLVNSINGNSTTEKIKAERLETPKASSIVDTINDSKTKIDGDRVDISITKTEEDADNVVSFKIGDAQYRKVLNLTASTGTIENAKNVTDMVGSWRIDDILDINSNQAYVLRARTAQNANSAGHLAGVSADEILVKNGTSYIGTVQHAQLADNATEAVHASTASSAANAVYSETTGHLGNVGASDLLVKSTASTTTYLPKVKNSEFADSAITALSANRFNVTASVGNISTPIYIDSTGTPKECNIQHGSDSTIDTNIDIGYYNTLLDFKLNPTSNQSKQYINLYSNLFNIIKNLPVAMGSNNVSLLRNNDKIKGLLYKALSSNYSSTAYKLIFTSALLTNLAGISAYDFSIFFESETSGTIIRETKESIDRLTISGTTCSVIKLPFDNSAYLTASTGLLKSDENKYLNKSLYAHNIEIKIADSKVVLKLERFVSYSNAKPVSNEMNLQELISNLSNWINIQNTTDDSPYKYNYINAVVYRYDIAKKEPLIHNDVKLRLYYNKTNTQIYIKYDYIIFDSESNNYTEMVDGIPIYNPDCTVIYNDSITEIQ